MPQPENEFKRLEIKKYTNRRYYDATHSRHMTLEEIRNLIHQGHDISVVDARTGSDITAQVLTQIILELETAKLDSLPVPLLLRMIRRNDELLRAFIEKYFNQALQSFLAYQQQWDEQFRRTHELAANPFPAVAEWTKAVWSPFTSALSPRGGPEAPAPNPFPAAPAGNEQSVVQMLEKLQREVEELRAGHPAVSPPRQRAKRRNKK